MKAAYSAAVILAHLFAPNAVADQAVDLQDFNQYKQMMLPVLTKSLEPLKQTRICVIKSTNSDQLNECVRVMAEFQHSTMPDSAGGKRAAVQLPRMEWSRALAEQLRSDIDRSLIKTNTTIKCIQSSDSHDTMAKCMREAK